MSALLTYVLGVLTGLVIFWVGYQIAWRHWNQHLNRDKAYLQEKIRSEQGAKSGLERQLTALKADIAGFRARISELERLERQAKVREEEAKEEKQTLVALLDAMRVEIATYKKIISEPASQPVLTITPHTNGKSSGSGKTNGVKPAFSAAADTNAAEPIYELVLEHTNGNGNHKNGNGKIPPQFGLGNHFPPADPLTEPVMYIERPRMKGDRLDIIPGINPALLAKLRKDGIDTFGDLSLLSAEELRRIAGPRMGKRIDAEGILAQANKLASGRKPG